MDMVFKVGNMKNVVQNVTDVLQGMLTEFYFLFLTHTFEITIMDHAYPSLSLIGESLDVFDTIDFMPAKHVTLT